MTTPDPSDTSLSKPLKRFGLEYNATDELQPQDDGPWVLFSDVQALFDAKVLLPGNQRAHYAVTADGQTFIMFTPASSQSLPSTTVVLNWMADVNRK